MKEGKDDKKVRPNIDFVKLNSDELKAKMHWLVTHQSPVSFWKSLEAIFIGKATHYLDDLELSECDFLVNFEEEIIFLNFEIKGIDYFMKGRVVAFEDHARKMGVALFPECFRLEKRISERVRLHDRLDCHAYIKYSKSTPANVVSINRQDQKDGAFYRQLNNDKNKRLKEKFSDYIDAEKEDLAIFKIEDFAHNGLSIISSAVELETIISPIKKSFFEILISLGQESFILHQVKLVHIMPYLNPLLSQLELYKVGLQFKASISVRRKVEELTSQKINVIDYRKEFEIFVCDEK